MYVLIFVDMSLFLIVYEHEDAKSWTPQATAATFAEYLHWLLSSNVAEFAAKLYSSKITYNVAKRLLRIEDSGVRKSLEQCEADIRSLDTLCIIETEHVSDAATDAAPSNTLPLRGKAFLLSTAALELGVPLGIRAHETMEAVTRDYVASTDPASCLYIGRMYGHLTRDHCGTVNPMTSAEAVIFGQVLSAKDTRDLLS